jgi:RNA polymerase sigma-70 factor (ECF subfamily)
MARQLKDLSTDELLEAVSRPDDEVSFGDAVGELVTRYKSVVYSQALSVCSGNRSLADDVFQETFLRLFTWLKRRHDEHPLHSFPRLLQVFSKRAAIDLIRKAKLREPPPMSDYTLPPEDQFYVAQLLESLDGRSREVIRLSYFEGLSAPEIGKLLNLKAAHVRILRFRALEALKEWQKRDSAADELEEL